VAWIESHQSLARHRKLLRLAGELGIDRVKAIGHLHLLWWWALDNADADGDLGPVTASEVAQAAEWPVRKAPQLLAALEASGFVDRNGDDLSLHGWYEYAGKLAEKREANRQRARRWYEERHPSVAQATAESTSNLRADYDDSAGLEERREEESTQPENPPRVPRAPTHSRGPAWEVPDWFMPLAVLPGYRAINHSKAAERVSASCLEAGVDRAEVVRGFAAEYPALRLSYGWHDPVAVLKGTPLGIAIKNVLDGKTTRMNGQGQQSNGQINDPDMWAQEAARYNG